MNQIAIKLHTHTHALTTSTLEKLLAEGEVWSAEERYTHKDKSHDDAPQHSTTSFDAIPFGLPAVDAALPHGGLPCGAIHELHTLPFSPPTALCALLAVNALRAAAHRHEAKFLIWIGRTCRPSPYFIERLLASASLTPHRYFRRCLFIDPPTESLHRWCLETVLRSSAVAAVVSEYRGSTLAHSKRLALAARRSNALGLLVRKPVVQPWSAHRGSYTGSHTGHLLTAAASCWSIFPQPSSSRFPCWELAVTRWKGCQPSRRIWSVELRLGDSHENVSLHVPSQMVSKPCSSQDPLQKGAPLLTATPPCSATR